MIFACVAVVIFSYYLLLLLLPALLLGYLTVAISITLTVIK